MVWWIWTYCSWSMNVIPFLILTSGISHSSVQGKQISQVATSPDTCITLNSPTHQPSLLSPLAPNPTSFLLTKSNVRQCLRNITWDHFSEQPNTLHHLGLQVCTGATGFPHFPLIYGYFLPQYFFSQIQRIIEYLELKGLHKDCQSQTPGPAKDHAKNRTTGLRVLSKHLCQT